MPFALGQDVSTSSLDPLYGEAEHQANSVSDLVRRARAAQAGWAGLPVGSRVAVLRRFRFQLAANSRALTEAISFQLARSAADTLTAEVIPLAEAVRFLERCCQRVLRTKLVSRKGRPLWLQGVELTVQRDPWGVVLVIGPANYPLFLPGVQAMQALAAGNAVVWKPGAGGYAVARVVAGLLAEAGLPHGLLNVTDESSESAQEAIRLGVDKIVMTGSEASGKAILSSAAPTLTPATVELSGCDALFVLADADLTRAADALLFGLRLNGSCTCIAPRRVFVHRLCARDFEDQVLRRLGEMPAVPVASRTLSLVTALIEDAVSLGAELATPPLNGSLQMRPVCLKNTTPRMQITQTDVFAPIFCLSSFNSEDEAIALAEQCKYALGASVFGTVARARQFASRLAVGLVVVNDVIAPTADPRISFGGRRHSGFGKSRGAEGLLEMTVSKTVALQTAKRLRHLEDPHPRGEELFSAFLLLLHGHGWGDRRRGLSALRRALAGESKDKV